MTLGELIESLEKFDPNMVFKYGITHPHSYRGYYDQLAFEPIGDSKVSTMLELAMGAVGETYTGYKGGNYTMDETTEVNIAEYGDCGDSLTPMFFDLNILAAENSALRAENERLREALEDTRNRLGLEQARVDDRDASLKKAGAENARLRAALEDVVAKADARKGRP